jgi:hypothetical protein
MTRAPLGMLSVARALPSPESVHQPSNRSAQGGPRRAAESRGVSNMATFNF